jgi:hypothetical protein
VSVCWGCRRVPAFIGAQKMDTNRHSPPRLTAMVTATAATSGQQRRSAAAQNTRTIRRNLGYVRPESGRSVQQPMRSTAVPSSHPHTRQAVPLDGEQGRASLHPGVPSRAGHMSARNRVNRREELGTEIAVHRNSSKKQQVAGLSSPVHQLPVKRRRAAARPLVAPLRHARCRACSGLLDEA